MIHKIFVLANMVRVRMQLAIMYGTGILYYVQSSKRKKKEEKYRNYLTFHFVEAV